MRQRGLHTETDATDTDTGAGAYTDTNSDGGRGRTDRGRREPPAATVVSGRFDTPAVPTDWDTGMLRLIVDPARLDELMPLRRGPVQGHAAAGRGALPDVRPEDLWWPLPEVPADTEVDEPTALEEPPALDEPAEPAALHPDHPASRPRPLKPTRPPRAAGASARMAAATVVSRVSGMAGQLLQAAALGAGVLSTVFTEGTSLPSMIYFLLVGGALNAVFVPQLVAATRRDPDGGAAYTDRLLTLVFCALLAVTALAEAAAPWIVEVSAGGLHPASRALALALTRYCLPQVFFYGVFATVGQVLGARGRFGATAWAPILNNVVVIAVFAGFIALGGVGDSGTLTSAQSMFLGFGTTAGVAAQAVVLLWFLGRSGVRFRPRFDWRGVGLGRTGALAKWTLGYMLVGQAVNVLVMNLASAVDQAQASAGRLDVAAGYAAYAKAQQVWILPQSVVTVSLLTVLLPRMSRAAAEDDPAAVRDDLSFGLRMTAVAIVPCAFAFLALGPQLAAVLFGYGKTDAGQAQGIGEMLAAFGLGLVPFSAQYVILRGFYAFGDTRTPFTVGLVTGTTNVAIAVAAATVLHGTRWPVVVMAAGYGLSSAAGLVWSVWRLRSRLGTRADAPGRGVAKVYRRLTLAAVLAAVVAYSAAQETTTMLGSALPGSLLAALAGGVVLVGIYLAGARALRVREVDLLTRRVTARLRPLMPR